MISQTSTIHLDMVRKNYKDEYWFPTREQMKILLYVILKIWAICNINLIPDSIFITKTHCL